MAESKYKGLLYSPEVLGGIGLLTAGLSGGAPDRALPSLLQGMQTAAMFRKQEDEDEKQRLIKEYADQVPADQKNAFLIAPKQWLDKNVFAKDKSAKFETFLSEDGKDKVTINTASKSGLEKATDLINNKGYDKISQSISGKNTSDLTTLSKKTTGDIEKKLLSGTQLQDNLVLQEIQFQPEFLTVQGKAKYKVLKAKDLAGLQLDADEAAYLGNYSEWQQTNLQYFNQYRKEITGVAAGEKEMSWLQDSIPSERDTPTTYQAKLKNQMMIQKQVIENAREFQKTKGAELYTTNADGDRVYSKEFGEYLKTKVKPSGEFISELFTSYRKDKMWDTDRTKRFMDYTFKGIDWESILTEYLEDQKN